MLTPMVPGWGFGLGGRAGQFNLDPALANVMAPRKRPRNTNNPILVMKDGKPFMGLSTPGGDQQIQAMLQVFLNVRSGACRPSTPWISRASAPTTSRRRGARRNELAGVLRIESRVPAATLEALRAKGHRVGDVGAVELAHGSAHRFLSRPGDGSPHRRRRRPA